MRRVLTLDAVEKSRPQKFIASSINKTALVSLGIYVVWVFATYVLEGRINLFHRNDPTGHLLYTVVANMGIGTGLSFIALRLAIHSEQQTQETMGFCTGLRTILFLTVFSIVGFGIIVTQKPGAFKPLIILNVFLHVLPISIAEVVVCWAVMGTCVKYLSKKYGKAISLILAIVAATLLFAIYNFAHSAPFNQSKMVLFLMLPGISTSLIYFLIRDLYSTIIFHNFLALVGIMQSIDLEAMGRPIYLTYETALASVAVLVILDRFVIRRKKLENDEDDYYEGTPI